MIETECWDLHAVVPKGTGSSSPVPSSYLTTWFGPLGILIAYSVVTLGLKQCEGW